MRSIIVSALLSVALAASAQGRKPDLTVFGQELGKPLSIPECVRHSAWDPAQQARHVEESHRALALAGFKPDAIAKWDVEEEARASKAAALAASSPVYLPKGEDTAPCVRSIGYIDFPPLPSDGQVLLYFPRGREPVLLGGEYVEVTLVAGSVTEMRADTGGIPNQKATMAALVEKFGRPQQHREAAMGNAMGAQFTATEARWKFPGLCVAYDGTDGRLDHGLLVVDECSVKPAAARSKL